MSSMSDKKLPFSGNAILLEKVVIDFNKLIDVQASEIPKNRIYKIVCGENKKINRSERKNILIAIKNSQKVENVNIYDSSEIIEHTIKIKI